MGAEVDARVHEDPEAVEASNDRGEDQEGLSRGFIARVSGVDVGAGADRQIKAFGASADHRKNEAGSMMVQGARRAGRRWHGCGRAAESQSKSRGEHPRGRAGVVPGDGSEPAAGVAQHGLSAFGLSRWAMPLSCHGRGRSAVEAGADIDSRKAGKGRWPKWTLAQISAASGRVECLKILMEAGCDIESRDKDGNTALDLTSRVSIVRLREACVKLLGEELSRREALALDAATGQAKGAKNARSPRTRI